MPTVAFIEEEHQVVHVLPVEILLIVHIPVIETFHKQGIVDKGNGENRFSRFLVSHGEPCSLSFHKARHGQFGYGRAESGARCGLCFFGPGIRTRFPGVGMPCVESHRLVGQQCVVPVHISVRVGDGENELVFVHSLSRKVLQYHSHVVGVLHQRYGISVGTFGFAERLIRQPPVEQAVEVFGNECLVLGIVLPVKRAGQFFADGCFGYRERAFVGSATPSKQVVFARFYIYSHGIAIGCKGFSLLGTLPNHPAVGIEQVKCYYAHLVGKGIGKLHVVIVTEFHAVVHRAVALAVVD